MKRATRGPWLALSALLLATSALASPLEPPLRNQRAVLAYEVEASGLLNGQKIHDRLMVRTTVFAETSGPLNPLAEGFTKSQQAEIDAMSAATGSADEGVAAIQDANRLIEAMAAACVSGEGSPTCAAARARYMAAEQAMRDHGARAARAQDQIDHDDRDDHRFLVFMAGAAPDGDRTIVEASYEHGGRSGTVRLPDPALPGGDAFSAGDIVVVDRRDGAIFLAVQGGLSLPGRPVIVDIRPLAGAPEIRRLGLPFSAQVTLAPQPTGGATEDFAGQAVIERGGLRYRFRWTLSPVAP